MTAPDEPYPRSNSAAEFAFVLNIMRGFAVFTVVLPALLVWCVCLHGKRKEAVKLKKR